MKSHVTMLALAVIVAVTACKKNEEDEIPAGTSEGYLSTKDFFTKNAPFTKTYTVDGAAGGTFTTLQGTKVTVPANAFVTQTGAAVTGTVTIEFLDIYKKSDMVLADKPTIMNTGRMLKSGGEFFIKALLNHTEVQLAPNKVIDVEQPAVAAALDSMIAFVNLGDSGVVQLGNVVQQPFWWGPSWNNTVLNSATSFIYSLYQFQNPLTSGSWCNSDNPYYFAAYPGTTLTCDPADNPVDYDLNVFLVFKDVKSMVHVYNTSAGEIVYPYYYAPVGLNCTVVAVGTKEGNLYSSFTPVTISANQTVNFTLAATTTAAFKTQLNALN